MWRLEVVAYAVFELCTEYSEGLEEERASGAVIATSNGHGTSHGMVNENSTFGLSNRIENGAKKKPLFEYIVQILQCLNTYAAMFPWEFVKPNEHGPGCGHHIQNSKLIWRMQSLRHTSKPIAQLSLNISVIFAKRYTRGHVLVKKPCSQVGRDP
jgi:hypothetical protein